jgi:hypothetical protein
MESAKDIAKLLPRSRGLRIVEIDKDLKPAVADQRLREFVQDAKRKSSTKTVILVSFTV